MLSNVVHQLSHTPLLTITFTFFLREALENTRQAADGQVLTRDNVHGLAFEPDFIAGVHRIIADHSVFFKTLHSVLDAHPAAWSKPLEQPDPGAFFGAAFFGAAHDVCIV